MKTTITKTGLNEVTLTHTTDDDVRTRVFWTPLNGGYVREGARHTANDPQACAGLRGRGNTLFARDGDELLTEIRREWRKYRREEIRLG